MNHITNKQVMSVLLQNGWHYGRKENIDKYIKEKWEQYGEQYIKFCEENDFMRDDFEE